MNVPGLRRPRATWGFLLDVVRAVTEPHADTRDCDARVEVLVAESGIGRTISDVARVFRSAAEASTVVAASRRLASLLAPPELADRLHVVGAVAATAAVVALVLGIAGTERNPFGWVLPAAAGAAGLFVMLLAEPLARAMVDRRS